MFVYEGRLNWGSSARDETAAIILPSGTMRTGDLVFILSQWTRDSGGNKKAPLSQKITIDKVTKTVNGDDTFTVKPGYYRWNMTSRDNYDKLDFILSTDTTTSTSRMEFKRVWKPANSRSNETGKIWVSKLNWPVMADNEFCLFIAPEGFGEGKPFLSMWQWSYDKNLKERVPIFRVGKQSIGTLDSNSAWFTCQLDSGYRVTCAWEKTTNVLNIFMKGPEGEQEVGAFKLFANTKPHDDAPDEVAELKRKIKELTDDLTAEKAKTASLTAKLAQAQTACQAEKTQKDNEIVRLTANISQLERDKAELQTKLDQALRDKGDQGQKDAKITEQAARIAGLEKKLQSRPELLFCTWFRSRITQGYNPGNQYLLQLTNAGNYEGKPPVSINPTWEVYAVDSSNDAVILMSSSSGYIIWSKGHQKNAQASKHDLSDPAAHWVLEGMKRDSPHMNKVVKIRNVKDGTYLDVKNAHAADDTAIITHNGNSGSSQKFELYLTWQY
ncbi:hypothetical protein FPHYL_11366 [Fusarium phyllophilum]|uniref:Ricin B lectin domain-containing protein n=1 Tax=Fusarium phyllophilum TaxID=47803 RepID=A0A8H5ITC9_9HYPO|nr:hypothetical protein FPHYL_11366 [Fusarium phyllophilum]